MIAMNVEPTARQTDFLAKAKEADAQADISKGQANEASWRKIAAAYRELARGR
jgi:hypothetical protein